MYPCWNRIPRRRGEWMIRSWISSSRLATTRSMRSMAFGTARSMPKSQQANYQGLTIWSHGKATLRRRIPGSLYRQSITFEGLSPPITKTIQKSRQRHLPPSIRLCRWLSHPLHPGQQLSPWRSRQRNVADLLAPPPTSRQKSSRPLSYSIPSGFLFKSILFVG